MLHTEGCEEHLDAEVGVNPSLGLARALVEVQRDVLAGHVQQRLRHQTYRETQQIAIRLTLCESAREGQSRVRNRSKGEDSVERTFVLLDERRKVMDKTKEGNPTVGGDVVLRDFGAAEVWELGQLLGGQFRLLAHLCGRCPLPARKGTARALS